MPGPASHMFIADRVAEQFNIFNDADIHRYTSGENRKYFKMGSSGPDLFFFAPDYDAILYPSIVLPYVRDVVAPIRDFYETVIEPVTDFINDVEEGVEVVLDEVTCNAVSDVTDRIDAINESLAGIRDSLMVYIFSESFNMFDLMQPPHQKDGKIEKEWYWFDILHSRHTGDFLQKMWDMSVTEKQKAYVLGYATHVAADVSGHPYVNQAVGGAARAHNARHHFVENIIDVWFYDRELTPSVNITNARLHRELPYGDEIDEEGIFFSVLDGAVESKDDLRSIFKMVSESMSEIFTGADRPEKLPDGITTPEDINLAYWLLLASYKVSTDSFIPRPEEPLGSALDDIVEAVNEFLENVTSPPTPPNAPSDLCFAFWSDDCDFSLDALMDWIEHVWDSIVYLGELIAWAASVLKDLFDILACTISAPAKAVVSSLLWLIQSAQYAILEEIRNTLVLAAIVHPQPEWVSNSPLAKDIIELSNRSLGEARKCMYPHRAQESNEPFLNYPTTPVEGEPTVPGPYPPGSTPTSFLTGIGNGDNLNLFNDYAAAESPKVTREIEFSTFEEETLPAIPLAMKIFDSLRDESKKIPDWNLDADRGYHYKNWKADYDNLAHDSNDDVDESWHKG